MLQLLEVETDGEFLPLETPKLRLEVIGDSITSGEGGSGAGEEMTWNSFCFNAVDNYAYMAAKELGAVYNCISQSGWGVFCSWEGNEQQAISRRDSNTRLVTVHSVTSNTLRDAQKSCIRMISRRNSRVFCELCSQKTPRGTLPVNSNFL